MYNGYEYNESEKVNAEVNLGAIENNYRIFRDMIGTKCRLMSVVKADAYGHGAVEVARRVAKCGCDAFAVATVDEGIILRKSGISGMILVLGYTLPSAFPKLCEYDISQTCASAEYLRELCGFADSTGSRVKIHLKLNTGMNRTGFVTDGELTDDLLFAAEVLRSHENIIREGIFSHFACADEPDKDFTRLQDERFISCVRALEKQGVKFGIRHISSTMGIVNFPEDNFRLDMVRLGIGLYGYTSPSISELIPAMSYNASVIAVNKLKKGDFVGYGITYKAPRDMVAATICAGYADGFRRGLSNKGSVLCHGKKCPVIGNVCMDMTMIDAEAIKDTVKVGDRVTLFGFNEGELVGADEVAKSLGTISYELLCALGNRLKRVYRD